MDEFIKLIKELRIKKNLSTSKLAELMGVSQGFVSQLENKRRKKPPNPEMIKKFSEVLDYDYYQLMRIAGYMEPPEEEIKKSSLIWRYMEGIKKELGLEPFDYLKINLTNFQNSKYYQYFTKHSNNVSLEELLLQHFAEVAELGDFVKVYLLNKGLMSEIQKDLNMSSEELTFKLDQQEFRDYDEKFFQYLKEITIVDLYQWAADEKYNLLNELYKYVRILLDTDKYKITFEVPMYKRKYGNKNLTDDNFDEIIESLILHESGYYIGNMDIIKLSEEEAREDFLHLENLLSMDENIYINKRKLSPEQKSRALDILKLIFPN